jgi:hypothetical protein
MTHCAKWEADVALYAGGDPVDAEVVRHLADCAGCRHFAEEMAAEIERWKQPGEISEEAVEELCRRVMAEIERPRRRGYLFPSAIAAAVILAAALGIKTVPKGEPSPRPSVALSQPQRGAGSEPAGSRLVSTPARQVRRAPGRTRRPTPPNSTQASVIKLLTDDPDVIILLVNSNGDGE